MDITKYMMVFFISFELSCTWDIHKGTLMMFPVLNITTIIFVLTNIVMNKLIKK